ncbi:hypothetical protein B1756_05420 [Natrarchaeobaculum aegyptiacum]|uniref:NAD-dependent epimerase/dehydratase domain-containing protein n=1 Tax=Natrarchaeobaculum aegyptiacum TaxID=745377 RepID=A0A2Z2HWG6_9EURY|nr:hypothetical protein B1756_05420 [Natrarchaeobaculum aegyptiacum]
MERLEGPVGVLGASGYVGGAAVAALEAAGVDVRPAAGSSHDRYPTVDVRDRTAVREFVEGCGCVVDAAGLVGIGTCADDPDAAFEINALGSATVAWACRRRSVPLVHCSSAAAIGYPETLPVTAGHPRDPATTYGYTKLLGERAVRTVTDGSVPSITFVLTNPYGTVETVHGSAADGASVVDFFLERAAAGNSLPVHRPGTQERDLIHVRDAARAVVAAVNALAGSTRTDSIDPRQGTDPRERTFVLGSGDSYSVLEVAGLVAAASTELTGSSPDLELRTRPSDRPVIDRFTVDPDPLETALDVTPTVDLESWICGELEGRLERDRTSVRG